MDVDQNKQVPAAVITLASGTSEIFPILFTTQPCAKDEQPITSPWLVKSFVVTTMRDWGVSLAKVNLVCNFNEGDILLPSFPNVQKYRGGIYPYVSCEDEIRIYAGYLPAERDNTPITKADLSEYEINENGELVQSNPTGHLLPIFWGFIDKEEQSISEKGITRTLSCRDRMRVFQDTRLISLDLDSKALKDFSGKTEDIPLSGDRIELLMHIAQNISGNLSESLNLDNQVKQVLCWREITEGLTVKGYGVDLAKPDEYVNLSEPYNVKNMPIKGLGENEVVANPSLWLKAACFFPPTPKGDPRFHIWAERPPVTKGFSQGVLQVINKTPIEIINHLALTEERPIDFFASHTNGDYVFGPRSADFSGLKDSKRFNRTYYCLATPAELKTCAKNQIIALKAVTSTLGTYNKYLVVDSGVNNSRRSLLKQTTLALEQYPYSVLGRDPLPPCRTQIIQDSTLDSWGNKDGASLIVGLNAARRWSRDINAIQIKVLGDPTWYPGEIFQVWNTGIHDQGIINTYDEANQEKTIASYKKKSQEQRLQSIIAEATKKRLKTGKINTIPEIQQELLKIALDPSSRATTNVDANNLDSLALPRYKVRTVMHDFTTKGFFSTIKGSADY